MWWDEIGPEPLAPGLAGDDAAVGRVIEQHGRCVGVWRPPIVESAARGDAKGATTWGAVAYVSTISPGVRVLVRALVERVTGDAAYELRVEGATTLGSVVADQASPLWVAIQFTAPAGDQTDLVLEERLVPSSGTGTWRTLAVEVVYGATAITIVGIDADEPVASGVVQHLLAYPPAVARSRPAAVIGAVSRRRSAQAGPSARSAGRMVFSVGPRAGRYRVMGVLADVGSGAVPEGVVEVGGQAVEVDVGPFDFELVLGPGLHEVRLMVRSTTTSAAAGRYERVQVWRL